MRCMPEAGIRIRDVAGLDALPADALALFGQDAFSTIGWYRASLVAGLPQTARAVFQLAEAGGQVLAVMPMQHLAGRLLPRPIPASGGRSWRPV